MFFEEGKGLYTNAKEVAFPESIVEMINLNNYTVELKLSDLEVLGANFATLINNHGSTNAGNDQFALFIRNSTGDIEFKNGSGNARPKKADGINLVSGHTITIAFNLEEGFCRMYSDGVLISEEVPATGMGVNLLMFVGHSQSTKSFAAYIQSIRFYDRALTEAEILQNATVEAGVSIN